MGGGLLISLPFATTSCSFSNRLPTKLECDNDNIPGEIIAKLNIQISPTESLSGHIKTDTGKSVSDVTFTCDGLTEQTGLNIDQTTGVISGVPTKKPTNPEFKIKFTANVDDLFLEGYTNTFIISVNPTKLLIDNSLDPINVNLDGEITPTNDISGLIKTDTGIVVKDQVNDLKIWSDNLPNGLSINESTGVISGTPTQIQESTSHEIKFSCTLKEIPLQGSTEINIQINGPQSIVCSQIEDKSIVVNESFSLGVANVKMEFNDGTQKSVSSNDVTYELLDSDGQSAASTLPQGLSFNTSQGKISGTVTSLNYYAPMTYKIKIIGSARIGSRVGYSNTFRLSMENNPLPDTVYNIDANNVLLGFTEGIDLSQYDGICNTMQIPVRVTSIGNEAFFNNSKTTIPLFIKNLTFPDGSNCSTIGDRAFRKSSLTSVSFPKSLNEIGNASFSYCSALASIDLSNCINLTVMNSGAFRKCLSLTSIDLSNCTKLTTLDQGIFYDCSALTSVSFQNCLTTINQLCFYNCIQLTSISFPGSLTTVGYEVFKNCSNLSSITWDAWNGNIVFQSTPFSGVCPDGGTVNVTNPIDDTHNSAALLRYLLDNGGGLPELWGKLPEDVYDIDENGVLKDFTQEFLNNKDAYKQYDIMEIPAKVTSVADRAFFTGGVTQKIPKCIKKITVQKQSRLTRIGVEAFRSDNREEDTLLETIDLLNCTVLTTITESGFRSWPNIKSIYLPASLNEIGEMSFTYSKLNLIVWDNISSNPTIADNCFQGVPDGGVVRITNPVQGYTSTDLLNFLKNKGIPSNWRAE